MEDAEGMSFSSFLAGALLKFERISDLQLASYMTSFENINCVDIYDDDIRPLRGIVYYDGFSFGLMKSLDDNYNNICTVKEYLYGMTNVEIRKYFDIQEVLIEHNNKEKNGIMKRIGIFKKIKTRVFR